MAQLTIRIPPELARELKLAAGDRGMSINGYVSAVLEAAVDPDLGETEVDRLRGRLKRAGLLEEVADQATSARPDSDVVRKSRAVAGHGRQLSDLVSEGRD